MKADNMSSNNDEGRLVRHTLDTENPPPLTPEQGAQLERLEQMPDQGIDFSDQPGLTEEQLVRFVRAKPERQAD